MSDLLDLVEIEMVDKKEGFLDFYLHQHVLVGSLTKFVAGVEESLQRIGDSTTSVIMREEYFELGYACAISASTCVLVDQCNSGLALQQYQNVLNLISTDSHHMPVLRLLEFEEDTKLLQIEVIERVQSHMKSFYHGNTGDKEKVVLLHDIACFFLLGRASIVLADSR